jgi:AraC-like DNA-binding protein
MENAVSITETRQYNLVGSQHLPVAKYDGHFHVFKGNEFIDPVNLFCSRKNLYMIYLVDGPVRLYHGDQFFDSNGSTLVFVTPYSPHKWETIGQRKLRYCCVFTHEFFNTAEQIGEHQVFKNDDMAAIKLDHTQADQLITVFDRMFDKVNSNFIYKNELLRNLVLDLIYSAIKIQTAKSSQIGNSNASIRITSMFKEILDKQFPINSPKQNMICRFPVDFADAIYVHVNHLNRCLKETIGKTTSQCIAERIMKESYTLLNYTEWNICEIAWCLGFEEVPHFINFFKKEALTTPNAYRKLLRSNSQEILKIA